MKKKIFSLIVAGSLLLLGGVVGFAASQIEDVTAQINYGISMKLNGAPYNPTETDGTALRPLIYKGRTYLPVAALGKALGVAVKWDGDTSTVIIGENSDKMTDFMSITYLKSDYGPWVYTIDKEMLYAAGKTFDSGLVMKKDANKEWVTSDLKFNPNGKYTKIGFTLATDSDIETTLRVIGDNKLVLKTIYIKSGVQNVEVDILGQNQVYFEKEGKNDKIVFGDIYFK